MLNIRRLLCWLCLARPAVKHDPVHIEGPLEHIDGRWLMRIPLAVGGRQLIPNTPGIATVNGNILEVELPELLVHNLGLQEGQHLWVHNSDGKFTFEWEGSGHDTKVER